MLRHVAAIPGGGPNGCSHPGCHRIAKGLPGSWQPVCQWLPELDAKLNLTDAHCIRSITPWVSSRELNLSLVDFTPNYLCDAKAMQRIHFSSLDPSRPRFIVVMRDPVMRAFSEWSMFALAWNWDAERNFTSAMEGKLSALRRCNETLFDQPLLLETLPTEELAEYVQSCYRQGRAMMYPQLSMYAPCILHALRYFRREQFLFLRYEDLMKMSAEAIVRLVGHFSGLHLDAELVAQAVEGGKCQPSHREHSAPPPGSNRRPRKNYSRSTVHSCSSLIGSNSSRGPVKGRPMSFSDTSPDAADYLADTGTRPERFSENLPGTF